MNLLSPNHPIWGMAFRPLYPLAAVYGAVSVLLWSFGYPGTAALPAQFWHAHEMIWGYTGAIVVAFLLTAVATWTGQPRTWGRPLMLLALLWLAARLCMFAAPLTLIGGILGVAFYWLAAWHMGAAVVRSHNRRNYAAVAALFVFGLLQGLFHWQLARQNFSALNDGLIAGLSVVAGFIGLVGMRVIPFFTAKRLGCEQVGSHPYVMSASLLAPLAMALLYGFQVALPLAALIALASGGLYMVQTVRWWRPEVAKEPMLWILFAGFLLTGAGLAVLGTGYWLPRWLSLGVHLVAVGGIGLMTVGMMVRTALGHTGRPLYPAPAAMPLAFWLMVAAATARAATAVLMYLHPAAYRPGLWLSGLLFAASLLLYAWRYLPWLAAPRVDGKAG
ncbi:NnrS family protein [Eikenella sp. S3360]|uniref:NnrS family protein n=1 Tax=Eikenella glucosivorans TaxID=2766967 RepID=A0ABS0N7I6_9NEIS|nr:NnrS family protein [Eikenella glucosivorans]MBH5328240.1 NnrS family protein [Eikenella glucosivorans]